MDLAELIKLRYQLDKRLEALQSECNNRNLENNSEVIQEQISDILKELNKLDMVIAIYQTENIQYLVMKLERLYMMTVLGVNEQQFNLLSEEKLFEIFDEYFPDEWVYKYDMEEKKQLLLVAICKNKSLENV